MANLSEDKHVTRSEAARVFGPMRHSTPEERDSYEVMRERLSRPLASGTSIFDLPAGEGPEDLTEPYNIFDVEIP